MGEQLDFTRLLTRPWIPDEQESDAPIANELDPFDGLTVVDCVDCERDERICDNCLNELVREAVSIG